MASFSDYLEDAVLNHFFRNTATSAPAAVYAELYTANPTDAGGGTPVAGGSYARVAITFGAPSGNVILNSGAVTFPTASGAWGTVTGMAIFDASTSGNMLAWGPLAANKVVGNGDTFSFPIGQISVQLT